MFCMKCGKEIQEEQVFCPQCLEDMARYPVKPGTTVKLPRRSVPAAPKKQVPRKKAPSPEELSKRFRRLSAWLGAILVAVMLASSLVIFTLFQTIQRMEEEDNIGKNYNTIGTTESA